MKIKLSEIMIPKDKPFRNDVLEREENVNILMQLISTLTGPFVMAIDSEWGTGKTTFLRMWMQQLKNEKCPFLYFNAWENDFSEDPLVSLIGEIESQLSTLCINEKIKSKSEEHIRKIKKIGSSLIKKGLPVALKIATSGFLDIEKAYEEEISKFTENYAKDSIENYENSKSSISIFKSRLSDFAKDVITYADNDNFPIIFFVDELDRCRPNYALELLEKIKHLFHIVGIVFILAIDKDQVGTSIKSLYGEGMKVDEYLRRFIDLDYRLPKPEKKSYCSYLVGRFGIEDVMRKRTTREAQYEIDHFVDTFSELADIFNFSLRTQEQCFSQFCIVLRTTPLNQKIFPTLLAGLICIRAASPDDYRSFVASEIEVSSLINYIKQTQAGKKFLNSDEGMILKVCLITSNLNHTKIRSTMEQYEKISQNDNSSQDEKEKALRMLNIFGHIINRNDWGKLNYLSKKIEISDQFSTD